MSHKSNRKRARNGLLFRNGKLIPKEEVPGKEPEASPEEAKQMIEAAMLAAGVPRRKNE